MATVQSAASTPAEVFASLGLGKKADAAGAAAGGVAQGDREDRFGRDDHVSQRRGRRREDGRVESSRSSASVQCLGQGGDDLFHGLAPDAEPEEVGVEFAGGELGQAGGRGHEVVMG